MTATLQLGEFDAVYDNWETLMSDSYVDNVFVAPHIQRIWWRRFGSSSDLHLLFASDDMDTFGFAPLMSSEGTLRFIGGDDLFDYHDFPIHKGRESQFFTLLCDHLSGIEWDAVELLSIPWDSPTLEYMPEAAAANGMKAEVTAGQVTPVVLLPESWEEYVSGLTKKARHELRRKLRRLEKADEARQYLCRDDEIEGRMEHFFRLMRLSSPDKNTFLNLERVGFFQDMAVELTARGEFRLFFLDYEDVPVAACICIDYGNSYFLYNSGYDPEFSDLSVGLLNKALSIRDAIDQGKHSFNFLKGNERYKYDLGGLDRRASDIRLVR